MATPHGTGLGMNTGLGREVVVLAYGFDPVKLVTSLNGVGAVGKPSEYAELAEKVLGKNIDTRQFHTKPGTDVNIRVTGKGCALVLLARKFTK